MRLAEAVDTTLAVLEQARAGATEARDAIPFVCVSVGDEAVEIARHGHRRAWRDGAGPWLGLGRAESLEVVSTCHLVLDGYGHAWLSARIAAHRAQLATAAPAPPTRVPIPRLADVPTAIPLGVAWRELPQPSPRALPLAYALGQLLHRRAGRKDARFSPTFQVPITPGDRSDPTRRLRRVVYSTLSVRFEDGRPEPFERFATRARDLLAREAAGTGPITRLLTAARAVPVSLAWKRKTFSAARPRWLDRIAEVVGGRACLSRIQLDTAVPPSCAVSSPARLATADDPLGGCVVTLIDDGERAAITACGSGLAGSTGDASALLDELLALLPR